MVSAMAGLGRSPKPERWSRERHKAQSCKTFVTTKFDEETQVFAGAPLTGIGKLADQPRWTGRGVAVTAW